MADGESPNPDEATGHDAQLDRLAEVIGAEDAATGDDPGLARILMSEKYRGSFSHPAHLREFGQIVENGAERAFSVTEREQQHRHRCDEKLVDSEVRSRDRFSGDRRLVIILCFISVMIGIIGSVVLVIAGYATAAWLVGGGTAIATLGGSIFARKKTDPGP